MKSLFKAADANTWEREWDLRKRWWSEKKNKIKKKTKLIKQDIYDKKKILFLRVSSFQFFTDVTVLVRHDLPIEYPLCSACGRRVRAISTERFIS